MRRERGRRHTRGRAVSGVSSFVTPSYSLSRGERTRLDRVCFIGVSLALEAQLSRRSRFGGTINRPVTREGTERHSARGGARKLVQSAPSAFSNTNVHGMRSKIFGATKVKSGCSIRTQ